MEDLHVEESKQAGADFSDSSSPDDDGEWEAFATAFRGKTTTSDAPRSRRALDDGNVKRGEGQPDCRKLGVKEGEGQGCELPPFVHTMPHRWVDYCSGSSSSSSTGSGSTSSSAANNSDAEDVPLLPPSELLPGGVRRCAPGFEGGGGGVGGSVAQTDPRRRGFFSKRSREEQNHEHHYRESTARRARRLPVSVYTDATAVMTSVQQQQNEQYTNHHSTWSFNTTSRIFSWFVLLHGCLCEAPLAVVEGLVRGPLYLVAAAWISIVSHIGASRHAEQRAELSKHAAALAREGVLLLVASVTLAVPFSTSCTVYGEVIDRADDWDVRTVPTLLGAVDPLRFFVFAFGQAGELASNGRPEPLRQLDDNSQLSRWAISPSSSSSNFAEGGGRDVRPGDCVDGSTLFSPPVSYVGGIAAQSMDTDRLGVGILHPPQEIGLRFRRGGTSARRAAVSAYRRLVTRLATTYRRFLSFSTMTTRIRGRSSSNFLSGGTGNSMAAGGGSDQDACVI